MCIERNGRVVKKTDETHPVHVPRFRLQGAI